MGKQLNLERAKKFLLDLISFGTPQAIAFNLAIILFLILFLPFDKLYLFPFKSIYGNIVIPYIFNGVCPTIGNSSICVFYSVGETRALSKLLHGEIKEAISYNPLVFALIGVLIFLIAQNIYKSYKFYQLTKRILP